MIKNQTKFNMNKIHADFSKRFLIFGVGALVVLFEIALAKWSLFFTATPILSLCYIFTVVLLRPHFMSVATIILLALLAELLGGDMLGVRVTTFYVAAIFVQKQLVLNEHDDFIAHWANFSLICFGVVFFRLLIFISLYFAIPNLSMLAFQIGVTILIFPIFFVTISVFFSFFETSTQRVD